MKASDDSSPKPIFTSRYGENKGLTKLKLSEMLKFTDQ